MSRVGKKPLPVPKGVEAQVQGRTVHVKGPKGTQKLELPYGVDVVLGQSDEGTPELVFSPKGNLNGKLSALWGTARALVSNLIEGVTKGYSLKLNLIGVGYRANVTGKNLGMTLGYSHPIDMPIPAELTVDVKDQTEITISGVSKQAVGQFAAKVRGMRAPEPFKGKGVRYSKEFIAMKEGKKK